MQGTRRKPPVTAIRGAAQAPDVLTQAELLHLAELQAAEWKVYRTVISEAIAIKRRLQEGAAQEPGALELDHELTLARRPAVKAG